MHAENLQSFTVALKISQQFNALQKPEPISGFVLACTASIAGILSDGKTCTTPDDELFNLRSSRFFIKKSLYNFQF